MIQLENNRVEVIGNQTLIHGNCLEVLKNIPDKSIDMILCDLPYGTTNCSWDIIIPFEPLWGQYNRIIKDNGAIVLFGSEPFSSALRMSNIKNYKYDWYWRKEKGKGHLNAKKQPLKSVETISVFYKKPPIYNPQFEIGEPYVKINCNKDILNKGVYGKVKESHNTISDGKRYPKTDLYFISVQRTLHPTQKPTELLEYLIKTYSKDGDAILDNCAGSFSTLVACQNTNRNGIGIEMDENYYNIGVERVKNNIKVD